MVFTDSIIFFVDMLVCEPYVTPLAPLPGLW